jgi:hypothetical protein
MTDKLPPNLLALFTPRPPLRYIPPCDHAAGERFTTPVSGVAQFLPALAEYKETDVYHPTESWLQRRDRKKLEKKEKVVKMNSVGVTECMFRSLFDFLISSLTRTVQIIPRTKERNAASEMPTKPSLSPA